MSVLGFMLSGLLCHWESFETHLKSATCQTRECTGNALSPVWASMPFGAFMPLGVSRDPFEVPGLVGDEVLTPSSSLSRMWHEYSRLALVCPYVICLFVCGLFVC